MMHKHQPQHTGIDISAPRVSPEQPRNDGRQHEAHQDDHGQIVLVLEPDDGVLAQIADVRNTRLPPGLDEHPTDVTPEEALVGVVGVEVGVGVAVMGTVATAPPLNGALDGTSTKEGQHILQRETGVVCAVTPETVVARGDAETGAVVVEDGEEGGLELEGGGEGADDANDGDDDEDGCRDPLNLAEDVVEGDGWARLCGL